MEPQPFKIEYDEVMVPIGEELEVFAVDPSCVRILDVTQIGNEMRYRYTVVWSAEVLKRERVSHDGD